MTQILNTALNTHSLTRARINLHANKTWNFRGLEVIIKRVVCPKVNLSCWLQSEVGSYTYRRVLVSTIIYKKREKTRFQRGKFSYMYVKNHHAFFHNKIGMAGNDIKLKIHFFVIFCLRNSFFAWWNIGEWEYE